MRIEAIEKSIEGIFDTVGGCIGWARDFDIDIHDDDELACNINDVLWELGEAEIDDYKYRIDLDYSRELNGYLDGIAGKIWDGIINAR